LCCCHADSHEAASPSPYATLRTGNGATSVRGDARDSASARDLR